MIRFVYAPDPDVIPLKTSYKIHPPQTLVDTAQAMRQIAALKQSHGDDAAVKHAQLSFPFQPNGGLVWTADIEPPREFLKLISAKESAVLYYAGLDYMTQLNSMSHALNQACTSWAARAGDVQTQLRSADEHWKRMCPAALPSTTGEGNDWRRDVQTLNENLPAESRARQLLFKYAQRRQACDTALELLQNSVMLPSASKCVFQIAPELSGNAKALCVWLRDASERMADDAVKAIYTAHLHALCNLRDPSHVL